MDALRQTFSYRLAVPLFERLVSDFALDEQLHEFSALCLALKRHSTSDPIGLRGVSQAVHSIERVDAVMPILHQSASASYDEGWWNSACSV